MSRSTQIIFFLVTASLLQLSWGVTLLAQCPGGLATSGSVIRWGSGPLTVVKWSYVETEFMETEDNPAVLIKPIIDGDLGMPADARARIQLAFDTWQAVSDLTFELVADDVSVPIRIGCHVIAVPLELAHAYFPGTDAIDGDVHMGIFTDPVWDPVEFYATVKHEIGHAIGISHIKEEDGVDDVLMYGTIGNMALGELKPKDRAYIQYMYGPPIPLLTALDDVDSSLRMQWNYPQDVDDGNAPTSSWCADFDRPDISAEMDVTNVVQHALASFEAQTVPLTVQTLTDGAEDAEVRLFDEEVGDGPVFISQDEFVELTNWTRKAGLVPAGGGALAWHVDHSQVEFFVDTYSLPLLSSVILYSTATSRLRLQRQYLMRATESISYRYSTDRGETFTTLETEEGTEDGVDPVVDFGQKDFDLGAQIAADSRITLDMVYEYNAFFWDDPEAGVTIDLIELVDVLAENGAFSSHSTTILPNAVQYDVAGLIPGDYHSRVRAVFANTVDAVFSAAFRGLKNPPAVLSVNADSADGVYKAGDAVDIAVNFSASATVTGSPRIALAAGPTARFAVFNSQPQTTRLIFRYIVQAGDTAADLNYTATDGLTLNGGSIKDSGGVPMALTLPALAAGESLAGGSDIVIDTQAPSVVSVTAVSPNQTYIVGDEIVVRVTFDEAVIVTGAPTLELETGAADRTAVYQAGTGTTDLTFKYTVQNGDVSADLDVTGTGALTPAGGTMRDAALNDVALAVPAPGADNSLSATAELKVDGVPPTVTDVVLNSDNGSIDVTFSRGVYGDDGAAGPVTAGAFTVVIVAGGITAASVASVETVGGAGLAGGEVVIRIILNNTGVADGTATIAVQVVAGTIFGVAGNVAGAGPAAAATSFNGRINIPITYTPDGEAALSPVALGRDAASLDGNDGLDIAALEGAEIFFRAPPAAADPTMQNDYRPLTAVSRWRLVVQPELQNLPGILTWDVSDAHPDAFIYLQPLTGETPTGPPIDMKAGGSSFVVTAAAEFEIVYAVPTSTIVTLGVGWNLFSTPVLTLQTVAELFPEGAISGPMWAWNGKKFIPQPNTTVPNPERAYWLYSPAGATSQPLNGVPSDGVISIGTSWNLFAPVSKVALPPALPAVWSWVVATQSYKLLLAPSEIDILTGYWFFATIPADVDLN